jgi:hypothetical protein
MKQNARESEMDKNWIADRNKKKAKSLACLSGDNDCFLNVKNTVILTFE